MNYRQKANIVLAVVFSIFLSAAYLRHLWPTNTLTHFFYFVSEAALVGGIADWFAITAIFRKPLGWPYHTELIPRNRDKIINGITAMVQDELLSESLIRKKFETIKITSKLINHVEKSGGASYLKELLTHPQVISIVENHLKQKLIQRGSAKEILGAINHLLVDKIFSNFLDERIKDTLDLAARPEVNTAFYNYLKAIQEEKVSDSKKVRKTLLSFLENSDILNLDEGAVSLQIELLLHLRELENPEHPLRQELIYILQEKLLTLENEPAFLDFLENWKNNFLQGTNFATLVSSIIPNSPSYNDELNKRAVDQIIANCWSAFKEDTYLHQRIDEACQDILVRILQSEHTIIGQIVRETLEGLNNEELNHFIEDKAGNDLQWIRINGSVVGGIVGAILFLILNYGYAPIITFFAQY